MIENTYTNITNRNPAFLLENMSRVLFYENETIYCYFTIWSQSITLVVTMYWVYFYDTTNIICK
jgi:hypothetical protein